MGWNSGLFISSFPKTILLIFWYEPVCLYVCIIIVICSLEIISNSVCVSAEVTSLSSWVIHLLTIRLGCTCKDWILPLRILAQRSNNSAVSQSTVFPGNFVAWGSRTSAFLRLSTWAAFQQLFIFLCLFFSLPFFFFTLLIFVYLSHNQYCNHRCSVSSRIQTLIDDIVCNL